MIAMAAAQLGLKTPRLLRPRPTARPSMWRRAVTIAAYEDEEALAALRQLGRRGHLRIRERSERDRRRSWQRPCPARPQRAGARHDAGPAGGEDLHRGLGIADGPLRGGRDEAELAEALATIGRPAVLKTRRFGYDGKGQAMIRPDTDLAGACERDRPRAVDPRRASCPSSARSRWSPPAASRRLRRLRPLRQRAPGPHPRHHAGSRAGVSDETEKRGRRDRPRHRRGARLRGRPRRRAVPASRTAASARGQRDRAAGAQFRPLDLGRRRDLAVRAACARRLRLAARPTARLGRVEMQNLIGDDVDAGSASWPSPAPSSIFTARPRPGRAARWGT